MGVETKRIQKPLSAQSAVQMLDRTLLAAGKMDDAIFTTGVGDHQMVAAQLITWTQPRQMLSSGSLGTMGVSLGYCIGAKLANDKKICISVDGDGSFNMTFTELKTVAEQNIPIKILLLDNESQMMVENWQSEMKIPITKPSLKPSGLEVFTQIVKMDLRRRCVNSSLITQMNPSYSMLKLDGHHVYLLLPQDNP